MLARGASTSDEITAHKSLSSMVIEAVRVSESLLLRANHRAPDPDSTLGRAFTEAGALEARNHLTDAVLQAEYGLLSACDHARAFSTLIRGEHQSSTALMTLARGCIEAVGRVRWLVQDLDFVTLAHRSISLLYVDLKYPMQHGEMLLDRDGGDVDPGERRHYYESELVRLGLPKPQRVEITKLVEMVAASDIAHQDGKQLYSVLSSIAHGHRSGINAFVQISEGKEVLGLAASLPVITEFALQMTVTLVSTAEAMSQWYGDPADERSRIDAAWGRIGARLATLPAVAYLNEQS